MPTELDKEKIESAIKKRYSDASGFQFWNTDGSSGVKCECLDF